MALLSNTDALRDSWLPGAVPGSQEQQQAGVEVILCSTAVALLLLSSYLPPHSLARVSLSPLPVWN